MPQPPRNRPASSPWGALLALAVVLTASLASAATYRVPRDVHSIGAGLALAAAGDTVLVARGTYNEHDLAVPAGVTLRGEGFTTDMPVISAYGHGRVLVGQEPGDRRIVNLKLRTGHAAGTGDAGRGGAYFGQRATFLACYLEDNAADGEGGAVFFLDGGSLSHCWLHRNRAGTRGGAVASDGGEVLISGRFAWENEAAEGGAVAILGGALTLDGIEIMDNAASVAGGGLWIGPAVAAGGAPVSLHGVTVRGNSAGEGPAARLAEGVVVHVECGSIWPPDWVGGEVVWVNSSDICGGPQPVEPTTWGRVKGMFR